MKNSLVELNLTFLTAEAGLTQLKFDPKDGGAIVLPGLESPKTPGTWALPVAQVEVVLPRGVDLTDVQVIPVYEVLPPDAFPVSQLPALCVTKVCETKDAAPEVSSSRIPPEWAAVVRQGYHHGLHSAIIAVRPVQVRLAEQQLWGARFLTIRLRWAVAQTAHLVAVPNGAHRAAVREREALKVRAVNGMDLDRFTPVAASAAAFSPPSSTYIPRTPTGTVEGVIICPQRFFDAYRPMAEQKTQSGHPWDIVTYEWINAQPAYQDGTYQPATFTDRAAKIRAFLTEVYQQYGLESVLFGGETAEEPPYLPTIWDRGLVWGGDNQPGWHRTLAPHRSLGYYTNLDGGHHADLILSGTAITMYATFRDPDLFPGASAAVLREGAPMPFQGSVSDGKRCWYNMFTYSRDLLTGSDGWGNLGRALPVGTTFPFPIGKQIIHPNFRIWYTTFNQSQWAPEVARRHPELWGVEVTAWATGALDRCHTCDTEPELMAGYLPVPAGFGQAGVGLYQVKLNEFEEPRDPVVASRFFVEEPRSLARVTSFAQTVGLSLNLFAPPPNPLARYHVDYLTEVLAGGIGYMETGDCQSTNSLGLGIGASNADGLSSLIQRFAVQPMGLYALYGCQSPGWFGYGYRNHFTLPLLHEALGGPVVVVNDGWGVVGSYHEGPSYHEDFMNPGHPFVSLAGRRSLSQIGVNADSNGGWGWANGHQAMVYGDPTAQGWMAPPQRLVVTHPAAAQPTVSMTIRDQAGQPIGDLLVTFSKRKPDGTYAAYHRVRTNADGSATCELGDLSTLGAGVVTVEVDRTSIALPFRDFYDYHGAMALPGNAPPTVVVNLPLIIPQITPQGSWVILDAGASFDPDGDPVTVIWSWMDNRTGTLIQRVERGRYLRAFLPPGVNAVTVKATDGQATSMQSVALTIQDFTPPVVQVSPVTLTHWHTWATVPIRVNDPAVGGLNFSASDVLSGIGSWAVTAVTSNDPRTPAFVSFTLLPTNDLKVYAEENRDGSARTYTVTVQVPDTAGNVTTRSGLITVAPARPPTLSVAPVTVTQRADWVTLPIDVTATSFGSGVHVQASDSRGLAGWRVTEVRSNDARRPAPVTFTLLKEAIRVRTDGQDDLTIREYFVIVEVWNTLGLTATATGVTGVIPPALTTRYPRRMQGQVGEGQVDAMGEFVVPPIIVTPELNALVQFVNQNGTEVVRAQVQADGTWIAWLPYAEQWKAQATCGGRSFFAAYGINTFPALTPPGLIHWNYEYLFYPEQTRFVSRARPSGNQSPVARAVPVGATTGVTVLLDGRTSSDPDGDLLTYTWTWTLNGVAYTRTGPMVTAPTHYPITLTVSDGAVTHSKSIVVGGRVMEAVPVSE